MKDISIASHLQSLVPTLESTQQSNDTGFGKLLTNAIEETNAAQLKADKSVADLVTGRADNIHEVMLSMEEADISMRMLVQMRNKVVDAYQEIIRMQV